MDKFEDLQTFVRVVETGSISAAADRMSIAKSAVSRRISDLEHRLDVQLFQRTTRKLNLTETGKSFYERATQILADLEEAELAVSQQHGSLAGRLKIAAPLSFGLLHLGPAITEFMHLHPQIQFEMDFNDRQVDLLQEGFDLAIRIARLSDSSLVARRIAPVHHVVCASPDYLASHGMPHSPADLQQHRCLVYSNIADPDVWHYRDQTSKAAKVSVPIALRSNNGDFLRDAAIAGRGIILEPTFIVYQAIKANKLRPILTDFQWPVVNAYVVYPSTRHLSYRVRTFVDFLADRFAGTPYWDQSLAAEKDNPET